MDCEDSPQICYFFEAIVTSESFSMRKVVKADFNTKTAELKVFDEIEKIFMSFENIAALEKIIVDFDRAKLCEGVNDIEFYRQSTNEELESGVFKYNVWRSKK